MKYGIEVLIRLKRIAKAKWKWARLPRVDIAIFDTHCSAHLSRIIQDHSFFSIDTREESYHMPTFFAACWQYILCVGKVTIRSLYFSILIMKLGARICITNQDATCLFYELDKRLPNVSFVAMQQGLKTKYSIGTFSNISGDYFAFSPAYADILANGAANMYICGSIKANMARLSEKKIPRLCYIAGSSKQDLGLKVFKNVNYAEFTYPAIYSALREVDHFCSTQRIELIILSKANREVTTQEQNHVFKSEWDLYKNILGRNPPLIMADSYEVAGESELVVCDNSTLGYELLGRDCKVVFINLTAYYHREESYEFGWPLVLPKQGPFWTSKYDQSYIQNMLDHIWRMSSEEWKNLVSYYQEQLMHYDQDNSILLNHIRNILASSP